MTTATDSHSASLYVGDLAQDINEASLFEIFNAVGPVASIRVCRDGITRRSLGYAYVNFHSVADAERAIDTMNYSNIGNRSCRIMWSQRDPSLRKSGVGNIFVKNLDKSIDHKALYDTFSMFGNILSCKVATNQDGESLGYGFVHYETDDAAQQAIDNVNGMMIAEKMVYVGPFIPREERVSNDSTFTNVYVKNLPLEEFDESDLADLFGEFGDITSQMLAVDDEGNNRGFGFVNFEDPESAANAVKELNDKEIGDTTLYVARAMKKEERKKFLADKYEAQKLEWEKKWAGCNLYVKNLADTVTDEILEKGFEKFGSITSAKVMVDSATGKSKGFGFVCFSTPDEANEALAEMNATTFEDKPLYVAIAQKKEVRRAQLEAQYQATRGAKMGPMNAMFPGPGPMYLPSGGGMGQRGFVYPAPMSRRSYGAAPASGVAMVNRGGMFSASGSGSARRGRQRSNRASKPARAAATSLGDKLTLSDLANAQPAVQKQMIGEKLFPLIREIESQRAGKITGMLLEMDNSDLLGLLDSDDELHAKVQEAVDVLEAHESMLEAEMDE